MTNDAPESKPRHLNYSGNATIASVYGDTGGDSSTSVCKWIDNYRDKRAPKNLLLSDDTEGRFRDVLRAGAQITKDTVANYFLHNLFNLDPDIMSTIEVEMTNDLPATTESQPPTVPLETFDRAISTGENETFTRLFMVVHATPRKIKRVVNVYFLQRSVAEKSMWWKADSKTREQELVTWTILAEFWPFRLSCIAFAMTHDAPEGKPRQNNYAVDSTIVDVYGDSTGDPSTSVCKWIDHYRGEGTPKDLYMSDDTEGRFQKAIAAGATITKDTVKNCLSHSFNLNPAMMSTIEVEMVYDLPDTAGSKLANDIQSLLAKLK